MINEFFSTPIYRHQFFRDFNKREKNIYKQVIKNHKQNLGNVIGEKEYILEEEGLTEIKQYIQAHVNQYSYLAFDRGRKADVKITSSWLNLTRPGEYHHRHNHPNSFLSGVFYFETIPDDALQIFNPSGNHSPFAFTGINPKYFIDSFHTKVKDGTLLIFPSFIDHQVAKNESKKNRISLAFNTWVHGEIGEGINKLVI